MAWDLVIEYGMNCRIKISDATGQGYEHRWARYFKKVAERALNAKNKILSTSAKVLALYKAFKAIAAQKKKN